MKEKDSTPQDPPQEGTVLALPCHKLVEHPLRLAYYNQTHLAGLTHFIKSKRTLGADPGPTPGRWQLPNSKWPLPGSGRTPVKAQNDPGPYLSL